MNEKKIVDTFGENDTLSIEFLAHVIEAALSCEATADDLPVRMSLAASARMCLDFYVTKRIRTGCETGLKALENGARWVDQVHAQSGKNGDGR